MKLKLGIVFLVVVAVIGFSKLQNSNNTSQNNSSSVASQAFSSKPAVTSQLVSTNANVSFFSSSVSSSTVTSSSSSASISSVKSLSGARVDPLPEIVNFLHQVDRVVIPKIYLPTPKRDLSFDYGKATPSELREKALAGDPYAAYYYADLVRKGARTVTDRGTYAYEPDSKKRQAAMVEAREFYVRAFRGGLASAANVLSGLYAATTRGGNIIESLAWRKISFAVGEGETFECLRDSTTCTVKDFNNLNRLEYFYPCLSSSGDRCTQNEYDAAMRLALQYADSLEFAMNNLVKY